jgi:pimeloyl-ACP methyl ester carboxylesterase
MSFKRWLSWGLLAALAVIAVVAASGAWLYRDVPAASIEAKYADGASRFVTLDGVRFHYRDEGAGPVVLLIHANWANLIDWDPWVAALADGYRVLRFDMAGFGLTGPDPSGDYSLARTVALLDRLITHLKLERFTLAGASLGGTVAMHYAVSHPARVERLILASPGALNPRVRGRDRPAELPAAFDLLAVITPPGVPRLLLRSGFGDPERIDPALVERWHDFMLREGNRTAQLERQRQYVSGDIEALITSIRVPTLLMWGEKNTQVPIQLAAEMEALLANAPRVDKLIYADAGHQLAQEIGARSGADVRAYLDGLTAASTPEAGRSPAEHIKVTN